MSLMETRQLRYFVAVAEHCHFGRAAEQLGIAQPPLSRAIRDLERQLDVQLLIRTTRQVALTPAGQTLLEDARGVLDAVAAAQRRARGAGRRAPTLRLALKADFDAGLLPEILAAYETLPVELLLGGRGEQAPALRDGRADVALLATPFDDRGLDTEPLITGPYVVALAVTDPLAAQACVHLPDVAGRLHPDGTPAETGVLEPPPDAPATTLDMAKIFNLVEVGSVVWFLPQWVARRFPRQNTVYRPVEGLDPATLMAAWPSASRSTAVAAFVRTAKEVAEATAFAAEDEHAAARGTR
jgi:DNA-binding transcriptional LysR family regulator